MTLFTPEDVERASREYSPLFWSLYSAADTGPERDAYERLSAQKLGHMSFALEAALPDPWRKLIEAVDGLTKAPDTLKNAIAVSIALRDFITHRAKVTG